MLRLREKEKKLIMDDQVMDGQWQTACLLCQAVMERRREGQGGDGGDGKAETEEMGRESD